MSAFHRIDDVRAMPALRFINFAMRLIGYKGIIRALAEAERAAEQEGKLPAQARPTSAASPARPTADIRQNRIVESDAGTLLTDPAFAGMFERKGSADG